MNLADMARSVLSFAKDHLPAIKGAPEAAETVRALGGLVSSVKGFADPPTRAELDKLEAEVFAELDDTISRLGG